MPRRVSFPAWWPIAVCAAAVLLLLVSTVWLLVPRLWPGAAAAAAKHVPIVDRAMADRLRDCGRVLFNGVLNAPDADELERRRAEALAQLDAARSMYLQLRNGTREKRAWRDLDYQVALVDWMRVRTRQRMMPVNKPLPRPVAVPADAEATVEQPTPDAAGSEAGMPEPTGDDVQHAQQDATPAVASPAP